MNGEFSDASHNKYEPEAINRLAWMDDALCTQTYPDLFITDKGGSTKEARKICAQCESGLPCLESALEDKRRGAIYGGLSDRERKKLESASREEVERVFLEMRRKNS